MPRPPRGLAVAAAFWVVLGALWLLTGLIDRRAIGAVRERGLDASLLQRAAGRPLAPFLVRHYEGLALAEVALGAVGMAAALGLALRPSPGRARALEWISWAAMAPSLVGVLHAADVAWVGVMVQALASGVAPTLAEPAGSVRAFNLVMLGLLAAVVATLRRARASVQRSRSSR